VAFGALFFCALFFCVALGGRQDRKERQGPNPRSPGNRSEQRQACPPESAGLYEVAMRGTHRVAVDPLGSYLLPLAALQGLVDAYNQRSSYRARRLPPGALAALGSLPSCSTTQHGSTLGGSDGRWKFFCWSRPIAFKAEQLTVRFPGARIAPIKSTWTCRKTRSENSGAKGAKTRIISVGRVRIDHLF